MVGAKNIKELGRATRFKAGPKQVALAIRAGKVKSPKKKLSAQIRGMKQRLQNGTITKAEMDWFMERLNNPSASIADIANYIDSIKQTCETPGQNIAVANSKIQLHRAHFGDKHYVQSVNLDINVETDMKEVKDHLKRFI